MYAQLILGIMILAQGIGHLFSVKSLIRQTYRDRLSKDEVAAYQRSLALPKFLLGVTFIVMGIIETRDILSLPVFLSIYILICVSAIGMILAINKKHTDYYI